MEGEYVRLSDRFYLLDAVDEIVKGSSFCHTMTDFQLLTNGSLLILNEDVTDPSPDILLSYNEFCVKNEASRLRV